MHVFLTEDEASMLLQAACENQVTLRADIEKIAEDADFDKTDVYHFQAKFNRYEDLIRKVEHRVSFPISPKIPEDNIVGDFRTWENLPGGF